MGRLIDAVSLVRWLMRVCLLGVAGFAIALAYRKVPPMARF
jgi:hypothetical protein